MSGRHDIDHSNQISDMSSSDTLRGSSSHHNAFAHNDPRNQGSNHFYDGMYGEEEEYGGEEFRDEDLGYNRDDVGLYDDSGTMSLSNNNRSSLGHSTVHSHGVGGGYHEDQYDLVDDSYADERFEDEELLIDEPPRDDPVGDQMEASYSTTHSRLNQSFTQQQAPRGDDGTTATKPKSSYDPSVAFVDEDGFKYDERGEILLDEGEDDMDLAYEEGEYVNLQQDQRSLDRSVRKSRIRLPGGKRSTVIFLTCVGISSAIAIAGGVYMTIFWVYFANGYNIPDPPTVPKSQPTPSPTISPVSPPTMPPSSENQRPKCTLCEDGSAANLLLKSNTTGWFCSDLSEYVETLDAIEQECIYMRTIGVSECGCWSVSAPLFDNP